MTGDVTRDVTGDVTGRDEGVTGDVTGTSQTEVTFSSVSSPRAHAKRSELGCASATRCPVGAGGGSGCVTCSPRPPTRAHPHARAHARENTHTPALTHTPKGDFGKYTRARTTS